MHKTNTPQSTGFKLFSKNKQKLDTSTTVIKKDNKQLNIQPQTARTRAISTKKASLSREKNEVFRPLKKPVTTTLSTERNLQKNRTLSSSSRISTVSPTKPKPTFAKNLNTTQISTNQITPRATNKQMFASPLKPKTNQAQISKMKPAYEKGKALPFKKESPPVKLHKLDTNTVSTQSIVSRASKQDKSLSVHKSITINKMESVVQRSRTPQNKVSQSDALYCLVRPIFKDSKYYQTQLIHWHHEQFKHKPSPYKIYFELEYSTEQLKEYFKELFQEHFIQSFNCLQYCKRFTQQMKPNNKISQLPNQERPRRTIVFDLDETLIHCNDNNNDPTDHTIKVNLPNEGEVETRINIRPYCQQMLKLLSNHYELILFTASYQYYADKVLALIDPDGTLFQYRFYREHCLEVEEGLFIKDLRVIGNRSLEVIFQIIQNLLLVDNAPYSYCYQLDNGVPIIPFYDNKYDKELIFLTDYLINLEKSSQWTYQNKIHFRTYLYQQTYSTEDCLREIFKTHDLFQY